MRWKILPQITDSLYVKSVFELGILKISFGSHFEVYWFYTPSANMQTGLQLF